MVSREQLEEVESGEEEGSFDGDGGDDSRDEGQVLRRLRLDILRGV